MISEHKQSNVCLINFNTTKIFFSRYRKKNMPLSSIPGFPVREQYGMQKEEVVSISSLIISLLMISFQFGSYMSSY